MTPPEDPEAGPLPAAPDPAAARGPGPTPSGDTPEIGAEPLGDLPADLPPIDSIGPGTDLAPWLRPGIPPALKNAALRRKWLNTPAIRDFVDAALDYDWDWNAEAAVPGAAGRIGAAAVDKMLKALTEPRLPSVIERVEGISDASSAQDSAPDPETPGDPPAAPGARPDQTARSQAVSAPGSAAAAVGAQAAVPARRRHGGALPMLPAGSEKDAG